MPSTDEWRLLDVLTGDDSPLARGEGPQQVRIDGNEVDAKRVKLRRVSNDYVWRAYLDGDPLPPGTVICYGDAVIHTQPEET
jgi:hypothetical protein